MFWTSIVKWSFALWLEEGKWQWCVFQRIYEKLVYRGPATTSIEEYKYYNLFLYQLAFLLQEGSIEDVIWFLENQRNTILDFWGEIMDFDLTTPAHLSYLLFNKIVLGHMYLLLLGYSEEWLDFLLYVGPLKTGELLAPVNKGNFLKFLWSRSNCLELKRDIKFLPSVFVSPWMGESGGWCWGRLNKKKG